MKIQTNTDFINEVGLTIPNTSKDILIMIEYLSIKNALRDLLYYTEKTLSVKFVFKYTSKYNFNDAEKYFNLKRQEL